MCVCVSVLPFRFWFLRVRNRRSYGQGATTIVFDSQSSRTVIIVVESSRTDQHDVVVDVTSLSALDVVEIKVIIVVDVVDVSRCRGTRRS